MTQLIGVQELYLGCFGVGFLLFAGSLVFTGGRTKGAGRGGGRGAMKIGGRGGSMRGGGRGGPARAALGRAGAAPKANIATAKGGAAAKGNVRAMKAGGAKGAAKGAPKVAAKGGTARGGKAGDAFDGAAHIGEAASGDPVAHTYVNTTHATENQFVEQLFFFLMGIINPMSIASLIFFFGATGLVIMRYIPSLAKEGFWAAGVGAFLGSILMQNMLSWFAAKVENPELNLVDEVVGSSGEISVTILPGKLGEVVFVLGQGRKNYSAKAINPEKEIKRGTKVLIIDLEDNVAWVETEEDLYFDSDDAYINDHTALN